MKEDYEFTESLINDIKNPANKGCDYKTWVKAEYGNTYLAKFIFSNILTYVRYETNVKTDKLYKIRIIRHSSIRQPLAEFYDENNKLKYLPLNNFERCFGMDTMENY